MAQRKSAKLCARCGRNWAAHKAGLVGSCSKFRSEWKHGKPHRVPTGIERQFDHNGEK